MNAKKLLPAVPSPESVKGLRGPRHPLPEQLAECRRQHGITQAQAAKLVYTTLRTWNAWERGEQRMHPAIWRWFLVVLHWRRHAFCNE